MKSRDGKSKRREEKKKIKKRKYPKKEDPGARKGKKVGKNCVFTWFVAPEGRKVGSLKRRVRSQLARSEMKNWTPLWCEAKHFSFGALLEVEMSKKCTPLWHEVHFQVKMYKAPHVRTTFGSWDVEKVYAVVARSTFRSQKCKKLRGSEHFWTFSKGFCTLSKVSKTWGFCSRFKNDGRRGAYGEDAFRVAGAVHEIRAVRRSGRWFPHQIFSFGKMILRDRCSTSYDLASLFPGRRSTLDRWSGKIAKRIGTRPSALHSTFHFWKKSRRIASFLMLSTSKNQEVSQNFRFWRCQVQALRKSRRISAFLMLSSSKTEEVSQNSCVFKLAARQADRQTNR